MEKKAPVQNSFSYFCNRDCQYFPCHKDANEDDFNCLFCYCPLYALGDKCGGNFKYIAGGIKDCSACLVPHKSDNYLYIVGKFDEIVKITKKED